MKERDNRRDKITEGTKFQREKTTEEIKFRRDIKRGRRKE